MLTCPVSAQDSTWLAWQSSVVADGMGTEYGDLVSSSGALCHALARPCAQVLYTDVDTIFMEDINSCSLPSPRILSAAGEVTPLSVHCAVCVRPRSEQVQG